MADNTRGNPGVGGDLIATDEVIDGTLGTVKVQYVKIMDGTLDGTTKAAVGAAGLKVDLSATGANTNKLLVTPDLPSGASTAAKQPALGTAGTASADVLTVQGIASMTALKVDGSATTQPVSGTVAVSGTVTVDSELTTADLDTGVGTDTRAVVGLVGSKSGGGVLIPGDATKGLAVDLTATGANTTALKVDGSAVIQPASQSGTWTVQPGNTANTTAWLVAEAARSVSSQTALTTTATVSAAAGRFGGGSFINLNATPAYIQVFDTTGAVTLGTTVPTLVQPIPANGTAANGAAFVFNIHPGIAMANGIKAAATTTATGATTVTTALIGYIHYM